MECRNNQFYYMKTICHYLGIGEKTLYQVPKG